MYNGGKVECEKCGKDVIMFYRLGTTFICYECNDLETYYQEYLRRWNKCEANIISNHLVEMEVMTNQT
jgi:hypothetical protein